MSSINESIIIKWKLYFPIVEENVQDPLVSERVNIGFPRLRPSRSQQLKERLAHLKAQHSNSVLEKKARNLNCEFVSH